MELSKILHYKNNFLLWIDILFRPWKIFHSINSHIKSKESEIEKELDAKVELLEYHQYEKGIVLMGKNQIPVLRIPIRGIERPHAVWSAESMVNPVAMKEKKINSIHTSFSSHHSGSIDIKREAAHVLAENLVDHGFLSSTIDRGTITFSINCFGI